MSNPGSLLLVDDEPQVLELLRDYFEEQGYGVISAVNGRDALVLASLSRPDAVVLDIRMPGMQGHDVLRELRTLDDSVSVVMLSATDDEELARQLLQAGAFDYVRKPFILDTLDEIVRLAVRRGKRSPVPDVERPGTLEGWAPTAVEPDAGDRSCSVCRQPVPAIDTSAVRDRGALFHAACWLRRASQAAPVLASSTGR